MTATNGRAIARRGYQTVVDRVGMDDPGRLYNALKGREDVPA